MRIGGIVSNRGIMGGYLLGALALVAGSYAFPAWHLLLASAIGLASAGAVLVGVCRYRPRHQLPWWLLVAANVAFLAADTAQDVVVTMFGRPAPFPFLTDALYLVTCVLQAAATALHRSMFRWTEPRQNGDVAGVRIAVLTLAAMVAPVVLLVEALRGPVRDGLLVAVFSTVIFALVLLRLAGEITRHRQVVLRE